jgi:hypothetical protein
MLWAKPHSKQSFLKYNMLQDLYTHWSDMGKPGSMLTLVRIKVSGCDWMLLPRLVSSMKLGK